MSIISKEIAKQHLEMWLKAEEAVSTGQSYQIEQMQLTRASLKQIRESISFWEGKVAEAEREEWVVCSAIRRSGGIRRRSLYRRIGRKADRLRGKS